jgi:hypothetical protein
MSRTRLAILTAAGLATLSLGIMAARRYVLGPDVKRPHGPDTWKVTMLVQGRSTGGAKVVTATPLDSARQHVVREQWEGDGFAARPQVADATDRRSLLWTQRSDVAPGPFRARYDCFVTLATGKSRPPGPTWGEGPPGKRDELAEAGIEADHPAVANLARALTGGLGDANDQAQALYAHVEESIVNEPSLAGAQWGAVACLQHGGGDSTAKSRLLTALCRSRGIPARLVTGLSLTREGEELPHVWVEAWARGRWLPMCPFYRHFGRVPRTYLVFGYGDTRLARGRNVRGLSCAFLVTRVPESAGVNAPTGWPRRLFLGLTLWRLPPAEQRLVEFLLLLPVAALVICLFRNVIGVASFGTFAPALVGLVFRDLDNWAGAGVFVGLILTGWLLRRRLDRFHLLQVPRTALLLSCIIVMLIAVVVIAGGLQIAVTRSISLFPIIILTGMVERFWTLEEEDGVRGSFRTLAGTLLIAATIALVVSVKAVSQTLFRYPEALGLVMASQLLLGRYTGYRLSELIRFREVMAEEPVTIFAFREAAQTRERLARFRAASLPEGVPHVLARRGTPAR